jgi:hypothetical protein
VKWRDRMSFRRRMISPMVMRHVMPGVANPDLRSRRNRPEFPGVSGAAQQSVTRALVKTSIRRSSGRCGARALASTAPARCGATCSVTTLP